MVKLTLETREKRLGGDKKAEFLRFIGRFLQWEPEKRATAADLLKDPWLKKVEGDDAPLLSNSEAEGDR